MTDKPQYKKLTREELNALAGEELAERGSYDTAAARAGERIGVELEPDDARFIIDEKLRPLALLSGQRRDRGGSGDLLALTWKARVVPERLVRAITTVLRPLFW